MENPVGAINRQKQLHVLVAEDYEVNQRLIEKILKTAGYKVDLAANGCDAVELAARNPYDFILMDIQMPQMDGHEATRRIRQAENSKPEIRSQISRNQSVPIVALTGNNLEDQKEKCLNVGMNDCISKPVFRDQLLGIIRKWTGNQPADPVAGKAKKEVGKALAPNTGSQHPIDFEKAMREFMGEKEVLTGLLTEFIDSVRFQIRAIRQAISGLNFKEIAAEAHAIKGGAANLTAIKVAGIASALEKAADLQQAELIKPLAGQLEDELQLLENYLQKEHILPVEGSK